ncbi:MAG: hypothetical protein U0271_44800 [Polyangiaceae bacterium]
MQILEQHEERASLDLRDDDARPRGEHPLRHQPGARERGAELGARRRRERDAEHHREELSRVVRSLGATSPSTKPPRARSRAAALSPLRTPACARKSAATTPSDAPAFKGSAAARQILSRSPER